jgi:hypothetical protein
MTFRAVICCGRREDKTTTMGFESAPESTPQTKSPEQVAREQAEQAAALKAQQDSEMWAKARRMMADTRPGNPDYHGSNEAFFERESTEDREAAIEELTKMGLSMEDIRDATFKWTWREKTNESLNRDTQIEGTVAGKHIEAYRELRQFDGKYVPHAIVDGVALEGEKAERYLRMMLEVARSQTHPSEGRSAIEKLKWDKEHGKMF